MIKKLLAEAIESKADQLVLISRSDSANVYFLAGGRVKKAIRFEKDITRALFEEFSKSESPISCSDEFGKLFSLQPHVSPNDIGDCLSITITEQDGPE